MVAFATIATTNFEPWEAISKMCHLSAMLFLQCSSFYSPTHGCGCWEWATLLTLTAKIITGMSFSYILTCLVANTPTE